MKKKFSVFNLIIGIFLFIYALSMIYALFWCFMTSMKSVDEFRINIVGLPKQWTFENYLIVLDNFVIEYTTEQGTMGKVYIEEQFLNTVIYVAGASIMSTLIPCITAYLCSKFDFALSKIVYGIVLTVMVLPIIGSYPSEMQIMKTLGLYDTFFGVFIQKASFLGMYFLVFYSTFRGIPDDYAEAAQLDGASEWSILLRIMLPLVRNVFFTVMLLQGITFWNDYQVPMLYLPSHLPLSYGLYYIANAGKNEMYYVSPRMAGTVVVILPILIVFLIFKDKLMGNISMGGIKG